MPRVPTADGTENRLEHEVIGNKEDTAVTDVATTASVLGYAKGAVKMLMPEEITGTADIDISAGDYTAFVLLLSIVPAAGAPLLDAVLELDLNKTTTGAHAVGTANDTLDLCIASKIDGTNARGVQAATQVTIADSPGLEAQGRRFDLGFVSETGGAYLYAKVDTERGDVEIPYRLTYRAAAAPTVTPVAAG